ncbi:MAG: hypothetical protein ATN35_01315 [Epulopiscium sp. Nele67-Bin004]|nr:MAG: hypothetical protein ATN35_01315 [Epulopiscium sp. Nele67-Bin004]
MKKISNEETPLTPIFRCEKLTDDINNKQLIKSFKNTKNPNLADYLKTQAWGDICNNKNVTYIIKDQYDKLVLYFSIKTAALSKKLSKKCSGVKPQIEEFKSQNQDNEVLDIIPIAESIPAIELSYFCKNEKYTFNDIPPTGIGAYIFVEFITPMITEISGKIGCKYFFLYAADNTEDKLLINYYEQELGFSQANNTLVPLLPYYDRGCKFMFIDINNLKE